MVRTGRVPPNPVRVATPGSGIREPPGKATGGSKRGRRPQNKKVKGTSRKDYRTKYSQEDLEKAVEDIRAKRKTARQAAKEYGIPRSTIEDCLNEKKSAAVGRPKVLSDAEEAIIVERLLLMSKWGFPLTKKDTRYLIRDYLNTLGRTTRLI